MRNRKIYNEKFTHNPLNIKYITHYSPRFYVSSNQRRNKSLDVENCYDERSA